MTNISAVEKMAELMQQMEENSPRVAALQYCLSEVSKRITELEQKLAASQREFRAADATIENLQMQLNAEREAKLALAAENAGLKAFGDKLNEMYDDLNGEGTGWQGRLEVVCQQEALGAVMEEFDAIKTPATDAFLAEVRAQGVERLANAWYAIANETDPGISISDSSRLKYRQRADDAADFANEIRQEAAQ
ncbi:hypothetical protein [Enterobacter sichuanensis]|uniref:hypothetical protein n=1 Tax=Enterobacter sichuanensis TaxID=2071710 RepID=UPI00217D6FFF|nr:hypothetical protein [Enterobacter sichuanensis]